MQFTSEQKMQERIQQKILITIKFVNLMLLYSMMCDFFLMCWLRAVLFTMPTHPRVDRNKRWVDARVMTNLAVSAQSCASSVEDNDSSLNMASGGSKRKLNELESGEWISVKSYTLRFISEIRFFFLISLRVRLTYWTSQRFQGCVRADTFLGMTTKTPNDLKPSELGLYVGFMPRKCF